MSIDSRTPGPDFLGRSCSPCGTPLDMHRKAQGINTTKEHYKTLEIFFSTGRAPIYSMVSVSILRDRRCSANAAVLDGAGSIAGPSRAHKNQNQTSQKHARGIEVLWRRTATEIHGSETVLCKLPLGFLSYFSIVLIT